MGGDTPADIAPVCEGCGRMLDRIDHVGTERTIFDNGVYRDLGVHDGSADGTTFGVASDVDLRCGHCGQPIPREAREFFYRRWVRLLEYQRREGLTPSPHSSDDRGA